MTKTSTSNPSRRNRNIGTAKAGHGPSNRMKIPESWKDRHANNSDYYERVNPDYFGRHKVADEEIIVLYEKPREGWSYGCTPSDVLHLYSTIRNELNSLPNVLVFRQPTKKQSQLRPVWGRLLYNAEIGNLVGPAIFLESTKIGQMRWDRSNDIANIAERKRLISDGHIFIENKKYFSSFCSEENIRNTVLYRTIFHELGHWEEYRAVFSRTENSKEHSLEYELDKYHTKPAIEKEQYAHRFSERLAAKLRKANVIPFRPLPFECN